MKTAFVHVALCDNDFADVLQEAVTRVYQSLGSKFTPDAFKRCVVDLMIALQGLRDTSLHRPFSGDGLRAYLEKMEVHYERTAPVVDHDGGSVAIDVSTGYVWRY